MVNNSCAMDEQSGGQRNFFMFCCKIPQPVKGALEKVTEFMALTVLYVLTW